MVSTYIYTFFFTCWMAACFYMFLMNLWTKKTKIQNSIINWIWKLNQTMTSAGLVLSTMLEMWRSAACYMLLRLSKKMKFQSNICFYWIQIIKIHVAKILHLLEMKQRDRFTIDNRTRAGVCFHAPSYQIRDSIKYFIKQNRSCITWNRYQYIFVSTPTSSASQGSFWSYKNKIFPPCKLCLVNLAWMIAEALRC